MQIMNLHSLQDVGKFLSSRATVGFLRRTKFLVDSYKNFTRGPINTF
jgi:hypothetical protein